MKKKAAKVTQTIDLILTLNWERRIVKHFKADGGELVLTNTERYPHFQASEHWQNATDKTLLWGIAVRKSRTAPLLALTSEGKPLVYRSQEHAERIASWMNDPKGTVDQWAQNHAA